MKSFAGAMVLAAAIGGCAGIATAGTYSVQVENDRIVKTDRHYTNGIRLSWTSDHEESPEWARSFAAWLPLFSGTGKTRISYSLGQSIFTPQDTERTDLVREDRPYASWLYAGAALHSETPDGRRQDSLGIDFGIVGPGSFGDETQNRWHELIGVSQSRGWDNQIENEPGIAIVYQRKWRRQRILSEPETALGIDVIPHLGGSVGNVLTFANGGITFRLGQDLPADFGPALIRPGIPGSDYFEATRRFGWYLFVGAELRLVARNIFLDGNTFRDSHSVDKRIAVGDFRAGIAFTFLRAVRLSYTQVFRTREFKGQPDADIFGSLNLAVRF